MISKKIEGLDSFLGEEGSEIKQIFHPDNTSNDIRYSLAHTEIPPGKSSKPHKMIHNPSNFIKHDANILSSLWNLKP